jgi:hypothetical protein
LVGDGAAAAAAAAIIIIVGIVVVVGIGIIAIGNAERIEPCRILLWFVLVWSVLKTIKRPSVIHKCRIIMWDKTLSSTRVSRWMGETHYQAAVISIILLLVVMEEFVLVVDGVVATNCSRVVSWRRK